MTAETILDKEDAIRRDRARSALSAVGWSIGSSEVMFWAFAAGAAFGPAPLLPAELIAGALFAFALGMILSSAFVRRRLENTARVVARVREGKKKRRIVVYDEFLAIDDEVLALARVKSAVLTQDYRLELSITPLESNDTSLSVTRVFDGDRPALAQVRDELVALLGG